jgi:hypothetical protein
MFKLTHRLSLSSGKTFPGIVQCVLSLPVESEGCFLLQGYSETLVPICRCVMFHVTVILPVLQQAPYSYKTRDIFPASGDCGCINAVTIFIQ